MRRYVGGVADLQLTGHLARAVTLQEALQRLCPPLHAHRWRMRTRQREAERAAERNPLRAKFGQNTAQYQEVGFAVSDLPVLHPPKT